MKNMKKLFVRYFKRLYLQDYEHIKEVGAHLSGGLDSGSVASFAARELRNQNKTLHTYSYVPVDDFEDWTPRSRCS